MCVFVGIEMPFEMIMTCFMMQALAKRNVYYKLLQHKVVIDFQQKEPWDHPFKCLNGMSHHSLTFGGAQK